MTEIIHGVPDADQKPAVTFLPPAPPHPDDPPPCPPPGERPRAHLRNEAEAMRRFRRLSPDRADELEEIMASLNDTMAAEVDNNPRYMDRMLVEQSVLLDEAFRFYISGGEDGRQSFENFAAALRSQAQSSGTLHDLRVNRARDASGERERMRDISRDNDRLLGDVRRVRARNAERTGSRLDSFPDGDD